MSWYVKYGAVPLRRSLGDRWFQPLAKIVPPPGGGPSRTQALEMRRTDAAEPLYTAEFEAAASGEFVLTVNDAILSWNGLTDWFYSNNQGEAKVWIERVDPATSPPRAPARSSDP